MVIATRRKLRLRLPHIPMVLLRGLFVDLLGILAFASIVFGVWQWVHWLSFIVAGVMLFAVLFLIERGEVGEE